MLPFYCFWHCVCLLQTLVRVLTETYNGGLPSISLLCPAILGGSPMLTRIIMDACTLRGRERFLAERERMRCTMQSGMESNGRCQ